MTSKLASSINNLNSVAMGEKPATIVLKNCNLVNVYSHEIQPDIQISIFKDRIAYVGDDASKAIGPNTKIIDVKNQFLSPSFADPHIHIDQFVLPFEFAKQCLKRGVTSLFSDPIDMVSVCGFRGLEEFVKLSRNLPIRIFQAIPGGLPVDRKFSHSKSLTLDEEKKALSFPEVFGLGEVFSWTKVTKRDPKTMKSLSKMLESDCILNGHTAGASGKKLNAYVASGILSCHEPINFDQVLERLRLGMSVMIREGSIRRDLKKIISLFLENKIYSDRLMFCSDGLDPLDIQLKGHIDFCIKESIKLGLDKIDAISMASKNIFDYYQMNKDLGGIGPGKLADFLIFKDFENLKPESVFVGGNLVFSKGKMVGNFKPKSPSRWIKQTMNFGRKFAEKDFEIKSKKSTQEVLVMEMLTEIITKKTSSELQVRNGEVMASPDQDIWKVAAIDRSSKNGNICLGFLKNFGADVGAFSSSWSFHENDLMVLGSNNQDMALAANHVHKNKGGLCVVNEGKVLAFLPLDVAGIISSDSFEKTLKNFHHVTNILRDRGSHFIRPHLLPLFLPFLALPEIRILSNGIVDVKNRKYLKVLI